MWFTIELFGVVVFAVGLGPRRRERWIQNTDGCFELAQPDEEYEYEEEDKGFGFH